MRVPTLGLCIALMVLPLRPAPAAGAEISFEVIDLDGGTGELWSYRYRVADIVFTENLAFEVLFDPALYGDLDPQPVSGWDVLVLQPDLLIPDDGLYSAMAVGEIAPAELASAVFPVTFMWLGTPGTVPGAQPFRIVDFTGAPVTRETGTTEALGRLPLTRLHRFRNRAPSCCSAAASPDGQPSDVSHV